MRLTQAKFVVAEFPQCEALLTEECSARSPCPIAVAAPTPRVVSFAQLRQRSAQMHGDVIGLAALDLVLRRLAARVVVTCGDLRRVYCGDQLIPPP